jgi:hypothetical protein
MAGFRIYSLGLDGHVQRAMAIERHTDGAAIEMLNAHPHAYGLELWQEARKIATCSPKKRPRT